jgi:Transposase DDE domain
MITSVRRELARAGVEQAPEVVLADAGYSHHVQMQRLAGEGLTVLVPPDANKRGGARPGWDGGLYAFMRRALASAQGGALYAKRRGMIEPVFADTRFNRRIDRFLRRGRAATRSEWRLTNAAHNPLKPWRNTTAPRHRLSGRRARSSPPAARRPRRFRGAAPRRHLRNSHHGSQQRSRRGRLGRWSWGCEWTVRR